MNRSALNLNIILLWGFLLIAFRAAGSDCSIATPDNRVSTINVSTYVGNETPRNTIIYRNKLPNQATADLYCNGFFYLSALYSVTNMPSGPPVNTNKGPVFPTNVPGVGVAFSDVNTTSYFSAESPTLLRYAYQRPGAGSLSVYLNVYMVLIKTGPIASGSVVQASSFPTVVLTIPTAAGYTGLPLTPSTINWAGTISFTTSTCSIPSATVNMDALHIDKAFINIGSTTQWVDSSITLQNCPTFSGQFNQNTDFNWVTSGGGSPTLMTVSLSPGTAFLDSANGVFAVNAAGSTGQAATGVGIQLGYSTDINASPTSPTTIWKSGATWNITPPNDGRSSFKIPLAARYYQTSNTVTPGPANASVTFNIDYK